MERDWNAYALKLEAALQDAVDIIDALGTDGRYGLRLVDIHAALSEEKPTRADAVEWLNSDKENPTGTLAHREIGSCEHGEVGLHMWLPEGATSSHEAIRCEGEPPEAKPDDCGHWNCRYDKCSDVKPAEPAPRGMGMHVDPGERTLAKANAVNADLRAQLEVARERGDRLQQQATGWSVQALEMRAERDATQSTIGRLSQTLDTANAQLAESEYKLKGVLSAQEGLQALLAQAQQELKSTEEQVEEYDQLSERMSEPLYEIASHYEMGEKVHDGRTSLAGHWRWRMWMDCVADYPAVAELIAQGLVAGALSQGMVQAERDTANARAEKAIALLQGYLEYKSVSGWLNDVDAFLKEQE